MNTCPNCNKKLGIFKIGFIYKLDGKRFCSMKCKKDYINKHTISEETKKKEKKKKWLKVILIILGIFLIIGGCNNLISEKENTQTKEVEEEKYLEISVDELYSIFGDYSELSEIQKKDKYEKEFKDKLIKSSITADKIDKASLSSQYVVLDMITSLSCKAKVFFPSEEKNNLLNANIGDTIVFNGKLTVYEFGFGKCLTFSKDTRVLEIIK